MKKFLALVLAMIMVLALVACGGGGTSSTPGTPATPTQPTQPTQPSNPTPGTTPSTPETPKTPSRTDVNLAINTAWTTSDPILSRNVQDNMIYWNMCDFLITRNEATGQIENRIAKSYSASADGLTWTFELRDDVKFHNGDTVKASDVAFSIKRAMDPVLSRRTGYVEKIVDVVAKGDFTVDIILSAPHAPLLINLTELPIISEKVVTEQGDKFGTIIHEGCCGPYKLTKMDVSSKVVLEAFEDYYMGEASIKTINYSIITDSASAVIAFESGDLDWYNCSDTDYARIMASGKFAGESLGANHSTYMLINAGSSKVPALQNQKVRQAIHYAINRTELNYAAFDGNAIETEVAQVAGMNYAFPTSGLNTYEHNIEKAKALLAEAGYPNGVDCGKLLSWTGNYYEVVATMIQSQLAKAGIRVELEWNEQATVLARGREMDYDIYISGTSWTGDASRFATVMALNSPHVFSFPGYDTDYITKLADAAAAASDVNTRMDYYRTMHNYFYDYSAQIPLLAKSVPIVYNKDLNAVNYASYQKVYEWSWN